MNAVDELNMLLGIGPPKPKLPITLQKSGYNAIRTLGKGAFGQAYLVFHKDQNKYYVAKHINMASMTSKQRKEAHNEISIIQQFKHPNIVKYVECFEEHPQLYIMMEYADGGDLYSHLKKLKTTGGKLTETQVISLFTQVSLAIKHMHDQRVLHRDIKAQNVFLTKQHVVKLGDFGISTVLQNTMAMAKTMCGTPCYFSPELCRGLPYNNKSDVWALGVLLYEMCANRLPFESTNMKKLMEEITTLTPPRIPREYSDFLWELIQQLLTKDPARRPDIGAVLRHPVLKSSLPTIAEQMSDLVPRPSPSRAAGTSPQPPAPPPRGVVAAARQLHLHPEEPTPVPQPEIPAPPPRQVGGGVPPPVSPHQTQQDLVCDASGNAVMIPTSESPVVTGMTAQEQQQQHHQQSRIHAGDTVASMKYEPVLLHRRDSSDYGSYHEQRQHTTGSIEDLSPPAENLAASGSGLVPEEEFVELATVIRNMVSVSEADITSGLPAENPEVVVDPSAADIVNNDESQRGQDVPRQLQQDFLQSQQNNQGFVGEDFVDNFGVSLDVAYLTNNVEVVGAARSSTVSLPDADGAATGANGVGGTTVIADDQDAVFNGTCLCGNVMFCGWMSCVFGSFTTTSDIATRFSGAAAVELLHLPDCNFTDLLSNSPSGVDGVGRFKVPNTERTVLFFCKHCGCKIGMELDGVEGCTVAKAALDSGSRALIGNRLS